MAANGRARKPKKSTSTANGTLEGNLSNILNGHMNGNANGHMNGTANGYMNGHADKSQKSTTTARSIKRKPRRSLTGATASIVGRYVPSTPRHFHTFLLYRLATSYLCTCAQASSPTTS
jgi:hypothetical protein